jgi:hypothetical protein
MAGGPDTGASLAERFEHRWRPPSTGVAAPLVDDDAVVTPS